MSKIYVGGGGGSAWTFSEKKHWRGGGLTFSVIPLPCTILNGTALKINFDGHNPWLDLVKTVKY